MIEDSAFVKTHLAFKHALAYRGIKASVDKTGKFQTPKGTIRVVHAFDPIWFKPKLDADYVVFAHVHRLHKQANRLVVTFIGYLNSYDMLFCKNKLVYNQNDIVRYSEFFNELLGVPTKHIKLIERMEKDLKEEKNTKF